MIPDPTMATISRPVPSASATIDRTRVIAICSGGTAWIRRRAGHRRRVGEHCVELPVVLGASDPRLVLHGEAACHVVLHFLIEPQICGSGDHGCNVIG